MKKFLSNNLDTILSIFSAIILYIIVFGISSLNPANYEWLLSGGDLTQNYIGGVLYRNSKWAWPIFVQREIGYPYGVSVLGTDSLPIMDIILKYLPNVSVYRHFINFLEYGSYYVLFCKHFFQLKFLEKYLDLINY